MITSRGYTDDDLPHIQAALASWIQEAGDCGYCHVGELTYHIYNRLCGKPQDELVQIWEDNDGVIIGISVSHLWDNAFAVYTQPTYRGSDVEVTMLEIAIKQTRESMQQRGSKETSVIIDVWDKDETRQKTLKQMGFEQFKVWGYYQERNLSVPISTPQLPDGFSFYCCTLDDAARYITTYNNAFKANWDYTEYRTEVMEKPGYHPENIIVVVAPDEQFAAITIMWLDDVNKVGLFEPVAVHRDFHRKGLGRTLMNHVLQIMQQNGMRTALVGHDDQNLPATALYHAVGFNIKHTSLGFKRE